jgi:cellulose synthase/poly-beta-1,6-N-acetylglucosamine synthase-like glycosyltransferase
MMALPQYLWMLPTYANIFTVFSFCNMHDISWGTKEGTASIWLIGDNMLRQYPV